MNFEIETPEEIDGRFEFSRIQAELKAMPNGEDGYFVLFCPAQGTLRVERSGGVFAIERRIVPNRVHHEISNPNEGEQLSIEQAEAVCRTFYEASPT